MQKNTLGLLLLAILFLYSQRLLLRPRRRDGVVAGGLALLVVLTHFGTLAAMALYAVALLLSGALVRRSPRRLAVWTLALLAAGSGAMALVYVLDPTRFARVFLYLGDSVRGSLVTAVLGGEATTEVLVSLGGILLFYALLYGFYRAHVRCSSRLESGERIFWLASILCSALLVLPLLDRRLMGRLALFAAVPLLVLFVHLERHGLRRRWSRGVAVGGLAAVVAALAVGESISARIHNAHHETILADLVTLESMGLFGPADLVVTRTGADHVCNWFFGVEAGVLPSLRLRDFDDHGAVYVLNPLDGHPTFAELGIGSIEDEADRYEVMRNNIPRPEGVVPLFASEDLEVFALEGPPPEWLFDADGRWMGLARLPRGRS